MREQEKNCAFQYAKIKKYSIGSKVNVVEDQSGLTLNEAKALWNKHFPDCAQWIYEGDAAEMVIWISMKTPDSYGDTLQHISTDAESDGERIWETQKKYFPQELAEQITA